MKTKKIAYLGLLIALSMVLSYVEMLIPINLGVPGAKPGFANIVTMVIMFTVGIREAFFILILRIFLVGFTFGSMSSIIYSLFGGILSIFSMIILKKTQFFSLVGVSICGGVFHNIGQIILAIFVTKTGKLVYYLPILTIFGLLSGTLVGLISAEITKRVKKANFLP